MPAAQAAGFWRDADAGCRHRERSEGRRALGGVSPDSRPPPFLVPARPPAQPNLSPLTRRAQRGRGARPGRRPLLAARCP